jgi:transposase-like protein
MEQKKEAIIAEYLTGDYSYRQLGVKYGIDFRKIHSWVKRYKGKIRPVKKQLKGATQVQELPKEVKQLQAELRKAKLHNEVLEEMLKLSEQLTGIELKKKFGTKQS